MSSERTRQQREVTELFEGLLGIGLLLAALWVFAGCAADQPRLTPGACDAREVAAFTARCKVEVKLACNPDPAVPCEVEALCDARLCEACPKDVACR